MNGVTREEALTFECQGETLVGVLHHPAPDSPRPLAAIGLVVVVGGPQYRVGSHRQFVRLARAVAAAGHPVLRFDARGMGDSSGTLVGFEHTAQDIGAAIDALLHHAQPVKRVVLWGLCDGASAALLYLDEMEDRRVAAVCLLNPWVRSESSLARTHVRHYYVRRLRQREFWIKLLSGGVAGDALRGLFQNLRLAGRSSPSKRTETRPYQDRMASGWARFGGRVLLAMSAEDYTAREFDEYTAADPQWQALLNGPRVRRCDLDGADHTLSTTADIARMNSITIAWLESLA